MVPSSASLIRSKGFPMDGMKYEICAATTLEVLSRFLRNVDLITLTIFGFGIDFCGLLGCWGTARSCREGPN